MNQDAISEPDVELRTILRSRNPDVGWLMVYSDTDFEETRWVRVRAERADRLVQFVVIVPKSDKANSSSIAAKIINEALRLLSKQPYPRHGTAETRHPADRFIYSPDIL